MSTNRFNSRKNNGSPGQLEGHAPEYVRPINPKDKKDLELQYEKINTLLNNPNMTLPDGGAKLKAKLKDIQTLLNATSSTTAITDKVSELSLKEKPDIRRTVVNSSITTPSPHLLKANTTTDTSRTARMMSLEESMQLQESQQKDIQLANMKKRMASVKAVTDESLADDLSLTMNRLQLDPETRRPDDDSEDSEGDTYYDDEGFDEED